MTSQSKRHAAASYAAALLELAAERGQDQAVDADLQQVAQVIDANPSLAAFLNDPTQGVARSRQLLDKVFGAASGISPLVANTLGLLAEKGRLFLLRPLVDAYHEALDERLGNVNADVTVARRLDDAEAEQVRQRLGKALGKNVTLRQKVDDRIIGGLVVRVKDKLIDASVRAQLDAMRTKLLNAGR